MICRANNKVCLQSCDPPCVERVEINAHALEIPPTEKPYGGIFANFYGVAERTSLESETLLDGESENVKLKIEIPL
jgi:hypothetical protein